MKEDEKWQPSSTGTAERKRKEEETELKERLCFLRHYRRRTRCRPDLQTFAPASQNEPEWKVCEAARVEVCWGNCSCC